MTIPGSPHGKPGRGRPAISDDSFIPGWARLADLLHEFDARLICQLHPASFQMGVYHKASLPVEYDEETIQKLTESYAAGAKRVREAGADAVEIHGAHAHEVAMFLSPYYNHRTDRFGGSLENRARFPLGIVKEIKKVCGHDFPVIFRFSGSEMIEGGRELEESLRLAPLIEAAGADALHVSCGMPLSSQYVSAPMDVPDCYNVESAQAVKGTVQVPVIAVGKIMSIEQAEEIISSHKADMVSIGRALLADPELIRKYEGTNTLPVRHCIGCNQGCSTPNRYQKIRCTQNPRLGREMTLNFEPIPPEREGVRILIAGAGPAGLEVACDLALRGFKPVVCEAEESPGGLILLAEKPPCKAPIYDVIRDRLTLAEKLGVEIRCGTPVTPELVRAERPNILIIATGSKPSKLRVPGADSALVLDADTVLSGIELPGENYAVIGGGMIGCETAEYLAERGKRVTLITRQPVIASNLSNSRRYFILKRMKEREVRILTETVSESIHMPDITVNRAGEKEVLSGFDFVVASAGREPEDKLLEPLCNLKGLQVYTVGDCTGSSLILDCVLNAAVLAAAL
jgi:2,4-dienoyl-CoA reductase-like NADH-dependent reductase (Old Yellow Enzyme family)/thioredoxin reductase